MQHIERIQFLDWDSDFFQKKIGRIDYNRDTDISSLLKCAKNDNYDLIYTFCTEDIFFDRQILNKFQGSLADRKVIYEKGMITFIEPTNPYVLEYKDSKLDTTLEQLAYESGRFSRFRLDTYFRSEDFFRMYKVWITKSVEKQIADKVFVVTDNDLIKGMVTLRIEPDKGKIGLIAVSEESQGRGYGKMLINACCNELLQQGITTIEVPTQMENKNACLFYERCGFEKKQITNIYHFWL